MQSLSAYLRFKDNRASATYNKLKNSLVKATRNHQNDTFRQQISALKNTEGLANLIKKQQNQPELQLLGDGDEPLTVPETIDALFERHVPGSDNSQLPAPQMKTVTTNDLKSNSSCQFITGSKIRKSAKQFGPRFYRAQSGRDFEPNEIKRNNA